MKLNKREQQAFDTLRDILDFYEKDEQHEGLTLGYGYWNSVREVFGIDLKECTFYKKEVEKFVRGKDKKHLCYVPMDWKAPAYPYGFFPFQVKAGKKDRERNEKNVSEYYVLDVMSDDISRIKHELYFFKSKAKSRLERKDFDTDAFRHQELFKKYHDLLNELIDEMNQIQDETLQARREEMDR